MGGLLRIPAVLAMEGLLILAVFALPATSSRVLLAGDEVSPSPSPNVSPVMETPGSKSSPLWQSGEVDGKSKIDDAPSVGPPVNDDGTGSDEHNGENPSPNSPRNNGIKKDCVGSHCQKGNLFACLQVTGHVLNILLQNTGETDLDVKIKEKLGLNHGNQTVHGNSSKKIQIQFESLNDTEIALNAGHGDCILLLSPSVSGRNFFQQFPTPTPVHGVYLLAFTVIVVGGIWACCKLSKREKRHDSGAPYQQLEMGIQPHSGSAIEESSTADGWDENWDDDWDEEEAAVKPPNKHSTVSVSSNGVSSKVPNKDGWDDDWDD